MNSLDSVKLSVGIDALKDYKRSAFEDKELITNGKSVKWYRLLKQKLGLKSIKIFDGNMEFETSAKILKDQYLDGLSNRTLDRYVDEINKSGAVELHPEAFIESAHVQKIDVTTGIYPSCIDKLIRDLSIFSTERKYGCVPYNSGVVITGRAKSNSTRLIAYGKEADLLRHTKSNEELLQYLCIEKAKGNFRIETNFTHYKDIRNAFHLSKDAPLLLKTILDSKVNVLAETFDRLYNMNDINHDKVLNKIIDIDYTLETERKIMKQIHDRPGIKLHEIDKEIAMRTRIVLCRYEIETIMKMIKMNVKGNTNAYKKAYENLIKIMQTENLLSNLDSLIEMRDLLSKAA